MACRLRQYAWQRSRACAHAGVRAQALDMRMRAGYVAARFRRLLAYFQWKITPTMDLSRLYAIS
jgi:hypothetical protein